VPIRRLLRSAALAFAWMAALALGSSSHSSEYAARVQRVYKVTTKVGQPSLSRPAVRSSSTSPFSSRQQNPDIIDALSPILTTPGPADQHLLHQLLRLTSNTTPPHHRPTPYTSTDRHGRPPLTRATITPPALNRQPSHHAQTSAPADATTVLTRLRPKLDSRSSSSSPKTSSVSSSTEGSPSLAERRTCWEDCKGQGGGYVSFPDFDRVVAEVGGKCGGGR